MVEFQSSYFEGKNTEKKNLFTRLREGFRKKISQTWNVFEGAVFGTLFGAGVGMTAPDLVNQLTPDIQMLSGPITISAAAAIKNCMLAGGFAGGGISFLYSHEKNKKEERAVRERQETIVRQVFQKMLPQFEERFPGKKIFAREYALKYAKKVSEYEMTNDPTKKEEYKKEGLEIIQHADEAAFSLAKLKIINSLGKENFRTSKAIQLATREKTKKNWGNVWKLVERAREFVAAGQPQFAEA